MQFSTFKNIAKLHREKLVKNSESIRRSAELLLLLFKFISKVSIFNKIRSTINFRINYSLNIYDDVVISLYLFNSNNNRYELLFLNTWFLF